MSCVAGAQAHYFGKLRSRGDFVRSSGSGALLSSLDDWMSALLQLLAQDPGWHAVYDAAAPVSFAVLGTQRATGVAGHWVASRDAAGRRFPFVMAASFVVPDPLAFLAGSPLALGSLWCRLGAQARLAQDAPDFADVQPRLCSMPLEVELFREGSEAFMQLCTIDRFETILSGGGARFSLRQTMLALGLLLQPVLLHGAAGLEKGLLLPLPKDPMPRPQVIAWWMSLVTRFFRRTPVEIAYFITRRAEAHVLVIGFQGASAATLRSVIDGAACGEGNVSVTDAAWVEGCLDDEGLRRLSAALGQPGLSMAAASGLFSQIFLGE